MKTVRRTAPPIDHEQRGVRLRVTLGSGEFEAIIVAAGGKQYIEAWVRTAIRRRLDADGVSRDARPLT